jgi:AAHS family 4-hydroxybenzoate transporter-like MFS transporter
MDRFERNVVVALAFALGGFSVWLIGQQAAGTALLPATVFIAGIGLNGAMMSMGVLAAAFYPTNGRSTGIAWMYGIGRIGGILGPIVGGVLLRSTSGTYMFYLVVMATVLMAATALWVKRQAASSALRAECVVSVRREPEAR